MSRDTYIDGRPSSSRTPVQPGHGRGMPGREGDWSTQSHATYASSVPPTGTGEGYYPYSPSPYPPWSSSHVHQPMRSTFSVSSSGTSEDDYPYTSTPYLASSSGSAYKSTRNMEPRAETSPRSDPPKPTLYICLQPGCSRSFARMFDLDRHLKTHFPTQAEILDCPKATQQGSGCKRFGDKGFTRKDHLEEHLRKVHLMDLPKKGSEGSRRR